ncbi:hypothetical protein N2152v2_009681 [Parachlorella kessleri]
MTGCSFKSSCVTLGSPPAAPQHSPAGHTLEFELVRRPRETPFASLTSLLLDQQEQQQQRRPQVPLFTLARAAPAKQAETGLRIVRVRGDGRCMFRALALGLARNMGRILGPAAEEQEADQLRLAVADAICRTAKRRNEFSPAVIAIEAETKLTDYCRRIVQPNFWGGEAELLVLSQMLRVPVFVYLTSSDAKGGPAGFVAIQKYGEKFGKAGKDWQRRRPVRLLYTGGNHYDLLIK